MVRIEKPPSGGFFHLMAWLVRRRSLTGSSDIGVQRPFSQRLKRATRRPASAALQKRLWFKLRLEWQGQAQAAARPTMERVLVRVRAGGGGFQIHIDQSTKPDPILNRGH